MVLNALLSLLFAIVGGAPANRRRLLSVSVAVGTVAAGSFAYYSNSCNPPTPPEPPVSSVGTTGAPVPTGTAPPTSSADAGVPLPDGGVEPPAPPPKLECKFKRPGAARAAKALPAARIVGGTDALPGEFPFATSLQTSRGDHFCGGSVFREKWILTAGHCVGVYATFKAVVGRHDLRTVEGTEYAVTADDVRLHPLYGTNPDAPLDYDVALVELPEKATTPGVPLHVGSSTGWAWAIGWGRLSSGGPLAKVLQKVKMPIVDQQTCKGFYKQELTDRMICSDRWGEGSCQGDSGGALLFPAGIRTDPDTGESAPFGWQIAGDVSWGVDCAAGFPGVYGRLTSPELGPQTELAEWVDACAEP